MTRLWTIAFCLCLLPVTVQAQSWRAGDGRATAPASISGDPAGGFEVLCHDGQWYAFVFTNASAGNLPSPATITIDGQDFATDIWWYGDGEEGVTLSAPIVEALRQGSRATIAFGRFEATFSLRGSSRALDRVQAGCTFATPTTSPRRFLGAGGPSDPATEALAAQIMAETLQAMRDEASKPDISVEAAWPLDIGQGWQGIIATIGASNYHYGMAGFGTEIMVKPPSADWQHVGPLAPAFVAWIDTQFRPDAWPRLVYQSQRGQNPPYVFWNWDGAQYVVQGRATP